MSARTVHPESKIDIKSSLDASNSSLQQLQGTFHFCNGDEYSGYFAVLKDKQKIVRQGKGIYKTFEGETYDGFWENDAVNGDCTITFLDKTLFSGNLIDMIREGYGQYHFIENVQIEGEFSKNRLVSNAFLKDPNDKFWKGTIEKDGNSVTFRQTNNFWYAVANMPSVDQFLTEEDAEGNEKSWEALDYISN